ncbi:phosphatase PAP2 family protein [Neobacillus niacini]|uniref:phosphatase PAP2 family protein n=1 Tax=Neobacillus niacini TaxID=86668 RepID=UPI0021CB7300|nr:phosphatase PAP2 family protein [Neobacillus niacini]MCM3764564.1 phosphatase PAP2 family protein [Neobacillus niacini]
MSRFTKKLPYLLVLLVFPLLAGIYQLLNNRPNKAVVLTTTLDQEIPFLPVFIIPYILWYGYIFCYLIYFCFKNTKVYFKTILLIVTGELICFLIYFFLQTHVPRPALEGDGFMTLLVQWIYTKDQPYNCFPSIHVLTTFAVMLASLHIKSKHVLNTACIHIVGSLIIISTLFVKQHVIFDMIASMFLVTFLYGLAFELLSIRVTEKSQTAYVKNK